MKILQEGVGVLVSDAVEMLDGFRFGVGPTHSELAKEAAIAADAYIADYKDEISSALQRDISNNPMSFGKQAVINIMNALHSDDTTGKVVYRSTYLRRSSRVESYDPETQKTELRHLPFSFEQLPGLVSFYGQMAKASERSADYLLERYALPDQHLAIGEQAKEVILAAGIEASMVDITAGYYDAVERRTELGRFGRSGAAYFLLKNVRKRLQYEGYVDQLSVLPFASNVPAEATEDVAA